MHLLKPVLLLSTASAALFFSACSKNKGTADTQQDSDECVVGRGARDGVIIPNQYIVTYKSSAIEKSRMTAQQIVEVNENVLERHSIRTNALDKSFAGDMNGFVAELSVEEVDRLRADEAIEIVEPDKIVALGNCFTVVEPRLITWSVNKVGYGDGTGKTAWVIDSGIDFEHPDLNVDQIRSKSFLTNKPSAQDDNGHGTHVAGIIGAKNNSIGLLGVASGASLVSLRVLDGSGEGTVSSIIQALSHVGTHGKAGDVVNLSVGEDGVSASLDQAVRNIAAKGIFVAIAAGNDNKPAIQFSPARTNATNVYTVSAIDSTGKFASFSNYGNDVVDVAAPGVRILSTYKNKQYAMMSGTSMATPHVAGLLLLRGNNMTSSGTATSDPDGTPDPIAHY